ncbi:hypothetical protein QE152_g15897 [Popillia japonica]|uniref:Uncharacterized protein n=1 Tax=Popillia japonica TaxID=7064 RepID=A0AAW1L4H5_POPJA
MQWVISTKRDFIVKQIKENGHGQREMVEKLKSDYEEILLVKDITIKRRNSIDNCAKYKHLSQGKFNNFPEKLYKSLGEIERSPKDVDVKFAIQGLTEETQLCQDILRIAEEEITFRPKFLQIEVEASETNDCNILNNFDQNFFKLKLKQVKQTIVTS